MRWTRRKAGRFLRMIGRTQAFAALNTSSPPAAELPLKGKPLLARTFALCDAADGCDPCINRTCVQISPSVCLTADTSLVRGRSIAKRDGRVVLRRGVGAAGRRGRLFHSASTSLQRCRRAYHKLHFASLHYGGRSRAPRAYHRASPSPLQVFARTKSLPPLGGEGGVA